MSDSESTPSTQGEDYAERLERLGGKRWKRVLDVQRPYRWNLRRWGLGRTLDVGCGNGRNLVSLPAGSVGVDHNPLLVEAARAVGCEAYTVDEFLADEKLMQPEGFDSLLASHLVEHLTPEFAREILSGYLRLVKPGGLVVFITPQERGYASDATHIAFTDFDALRSLCTDLGLEVEKAYSFPFPRWSGKAFTYNEFNVVARKPA